MKAVCQQGQLRFDDGDTLDCVAYQTTPDLNAASIIVGGGLEHTLNVGTKPKKVASTGNGIVPVTLISHRDNVDFWAIGSGCVLRTYTSNIDHSALQHLTANYHHLAFGTPALHVFAVDVGTDAFSGLAVSARLVFDTNARMLTLTLVVGGQEIQVCFSPRLYIYVCVPSHVWCHDRSACHLRGATRPITFVASSPRSSSALLEMSRPLSTRACTTR